MRRLIELLVLPCLILLTLWGCGNEDSITLPGEPPEGTEYMAFEVHRNSLEITDAAITWPSALDAENALLAVGRSGRGLLYPNDDYATPIFLDTRVDLLSVYYSSETSIKFCGMHDGVMGTMRLIRSDGLHTISNSATGNLTGVYEGYVCSDAGEILALSGEHLVPVFQAPEGVSFNDIVCINSIDRFVVAAGNDGAIFHRYDDDSDFIDESIEGGPDFTRLGIIYASTGDSTTIYALGNDEIWRFYDGSWSLDYDFAAATLNDIAIFYDKTAIVVGDNGLILQKEFGGTGWWDDFVDGDVDLADVSISSTFNVDGIFNLCGSKGEIFKESPTGWEGLNHRAEGPWSALHHHTGEFAFAANGNRVMQFEVGDWAEFAVWETGHQLEDIHVIDPTHIWALGVMADGVDHFVLFYNGVDWAIRKHASFDGFNSIWCDAAGDNVFVTDDAATIWWYHDDIWEMDYTHSEFLALNGLSGTAVDDLVAVGDSGLILRRGTEGWTNESIGTAANLLAIDGPVIVGEDGTVLMHDGSNWVPAEVTWDDNFNSVWYGDVDNIWVVGDDATTFHFDGIAWTQLLTHLPGVDFLSVDSANIDQVWIGGSEGYLLRSPD